MLLRLPLTQLALVTTLALAVISGCGDDSTTPTRDCTTRADCEEGQRCDATGKCTTQSLSCTASTDCDFGDYCVDNACTNAACSTDDECTNAVCVNSLCRAGCANDEACGEGQACNPFTRICEAAGCSTGTCAQFQSCEPQDSGPSQCEYNGDCNNDAVCAAYAQQVNDGNDYICSVAQQRCVVRPECGSDNDCVLGEICEPRPNDGRRVCRRGCRDNGRLWVRRSLRDQPGSVCVDGCDTDDDCTGDNQVCSNLVCIDTCTQRSDCTNINIGYVCTGNPRICQGCTDSSQCPSTQFCDFTLGNSPDEIENPSVGLCVDLPPTCPDDSYGNNVTLDAAYEVTTFPFSPTAEDRPLFCRERTGGDWFKINAQIGDVIDVKLDYAFDGNLDLALRAADGRELAVSDRSPADDNGTEEVRFGTDLGGIFYVQVRGNIIADNSPYNLTINVAPAAACTDDAFEPNDDLASAAVLPVATDNVGLEVCGDDADFYTLEAAANQVVRIRASAPPRLGNIDLVLRDSAGVIVAQAVTNATVEELLYTTEAADDLVLEVRIATGVGNVVYDLEWTQFDNVCTDTFELNDTCNDASTIGSGTYTDLAVCADADYYAFDLLPLQTLSVKAIYDPTTAAGDLDITLFGPNDCATFVQSESREVIPNSSLVAETLLYQAPTGGRFNVLASLFAGINVPYTLEVDIQDGPPCVDDVNEPNDDATNAVIIPASGAAAGTSNIITGGKVCDANQDWYAIDLVEGDEIRWEVKFSNAQGNLDAFLIGPSNNVIASSVTNNDLETVTYTVGVGEAGTYYLRVEGKFPARADYWVLTYLNGVGPADPACPDDYENNDTAATAAPVTPGSYGLLVCGNPIDDDWFSTDLLAGESLTIDLTFPQAQGNVDIVLYDDSNTTSSVAESRSTTDNESVSYTTARDQTVKWRVFTPGTRPAIPYGMNVSVTPAAVCADDTFEPNEDSGAAKQLDTPGLYSGLNKCEGNVDWFKFDGVAGRKYEVFLNFVHRLADLNVTVYDSTLTVVGQGNSTTDDESVVFTAAANGVYFVKIESVGRARLVYDLMLYADLNGDGVFGPGEGPEDRVCPDAFENNDTRATARPMPLGTSSNLLLCWTGGAGNDSDYYTFYVPQGATLTVDLTFLQSQGDINARMYRGTEAATAADGNSTTDNEQLVVTNTGTGETYVLWVFGATGSFSSRYGISSSLSFSTTCPEDSVGSPDLATASGATALSSDTYPDLALCEGTTDYFRLPSGTTTVDANLELNALLGAMTFELVDSTDTVVATGTADAGVRSIATTGLNGASTYYLRVSATNNAFIRNTYDLWVSLNNTLPAAPFCADKYERNDDYTSAYALDVNQGVMLTDALACGADEDWYSISVFANSDYVFNTFFDHVAGQSDLALEVKDTNGNTLANGTVNSATSDELLTFRPTTAGTVYLGVKNVSGSTTETPYYMFVNRKLAACVEDAYEPNDIVANEYNAPALLTIPGAYGLTSCGGSMANPEVDYYSFEAPATGNYTVDVYFDQAVPLNGSIYYQVDIGGGNFINTNKAFTASTNRLTATVAAVAGQRIGLRFFNNAGSTQYFVKVGIN
ncbi:MAG: PPC domain-containing protein [bacterium]